MKIIITLLTICFSQITAAEVAPTAGYTATDGRYSDDDDGAKQHDRHPEEERGISRR